MVWASQPFLISFYMNHRDCRRAGVLSLSLVLGWDKGLGETCSSQTLTCILQCPVCIWGHWNCMNCYESDMECLLNRKGDRVKKIRIVVQYFANAVVSACFWEYLNFQLKVAEWARSGGLSRLPLEDRQNFLTGVGMKEFGYVKWAGIAPGQEWDVIVVSVLHPCYQALTICSRAS